MLSSCSSCLWSRPNAMYGAAQRQYLRKGAVVNQHVRGLFWASLVTSMVFAQAGSSRELTDPQNADLIARVKNLSASRLERGLPTIRFEDWVRASAGPDWTITWGFSQGPKDAANHMLGFDSVDVRGDAKDGRYFRLSIGTATKVNQVLLFWLSGAAKVEHNRWVALEHLSQLPRLLHHASQSSHTTVYLSPCFPGKTAPPCFSQWRSE